MHIIPIGLALLSTLIFLPVIILNMMRYYSDYQWHIYWANLLATTGYMDFHLPHFLYQQLVVITRALIPFQYIFFLNLPSRRFLTANSVIVSAVVVSAVFYALLILLIYDRIRKENASVGFKKILPAAVFFPVGLSLIGPITFFTLFPPISEYFGYIAMSVFVNPTINILKPLSLLLFWFIVDRMNVAKVDWRITLLSAFLVIINAMTKPNFIMNFIPVLFIWFLIRIFQKKSPDIKFFLLGVFIPAGIIIVIQYIFTFLTFQGTGLEFAPLEWVLTYVPSVGQVILRFATSIVFPVITLVLFFKQIKQQPRLVIAYFSFLLSLVFFYFLNEKQDLAGNFVWGADITLFVLFVELTLFLIKDYFANIKTKKWTWRYSLVAVVWMCHLISGGIWYLTQYINIAQW